MNPEKVGQIRIDNTDLVLSPKSDLLNPQKEHEQNNKNTPVKFEDKFLLWAETRILQLNAQIRELQSLQLNEEIKKTPVTLHSCLLL